MTRWGTWEHPGSLIPRLTDELIGRFTTLLDVGGGGGTVGHGTWPSHVTIDVLDIFPPATPPPRFTLGNALDIVKIYGENSFDVVMACECIEHLEFNDGLRALREFLRVARKLVILTTPHGFQVQDPALVPHEPWANNPYQKHLSGWCHRDLLTEGYTPYFNGREDGLGAQLIGWRVLDARRDD